MKQRNKHILVFILGVALSYLLTAYLYAEVNPFVLPMTVRTGQLAVFLFFQLVGQAGVVLYHQN